MNKILVRIEQLKNGKIIEVLVDHDVTIRKIIEKLELMDISYAYERNHKVFVDMDVPIGQLGQQALMTFYLF